MREAILKSISKGGVSFVELSREVEGFSGDSQWRNPKFNIVLWSGLSEAAANTLRSLLSENVISMYPAQNMTYVVDGGWLNLPIAKSFRPYKHTRWLPVVFSLVK